MKSKNIKSFYDDLDGNKKKLLFEVLNFFTGRLDEDLSLSLKNRLSLVIDKIDKINKRREIISKKCSKIKDIYDELSKVDCPTFDLLVLKYLLLTAMIDMKSKIAEDRPDELLKEKFNLKSMIDLSEKRKYLSDQIMNRIRNGNK